MLLNTICSRIIFCVLENNFYCLTFVNYKCNFVHKMALIKFIIIIIVYIYRERENCVSIAWIQKKINPGQLYNT